MTDTQKLRALISESGFKLKYIAERLGISRQGLMNKINNKNEFKAGEIVIICNVLNITRQSDREAIFFSYK